MRGVPEDAPESQPGGAAGKGWQPPRDVVPGEVLPSRFIMVIALVGVVIVVVALVTQRDDSGGYLPALFIAGGVVAFLIGIRALIGRIRFDAEGISHTDLLGQRRIAWHEMDRPVVVEPRRRSGVGDSGVRGYELIIRRSDGRGPWLLATALFWERRGLERMSEAIGAPTSAARTRAAVENTYPGATTWLLRRTSTQWSIIVGAALMIGLVLWQTR